MSRITGHLLTQETHPCGRLVPPPVDYDEGEQVLEFLVPSDSRPIVYGVELDCKTGEIVCPCESNGYRHNTYRGREFTGTTAEHLARQKGKRLLPLITREPRGLCKHARKCREYIRRKGLLPNFYTIEAGLIQRLLTIPDKAEEAA